MPTKRVSQVSLREMGDMSGVMIYMWIGMGVLLGAYLVFKHITAGEVSKFKVEQYKDL